MPSTRSGSVTLDNWMRPPHNTAGYQHVDELIPTRRIPRSSAGPWRLPDADHPSLDVAEFLDATHTDAFVALHRGRVAHEEYRQGMTPATPHLAMSVSKSITATLVGCVVGQGLLSPDDAVIDVVPEFRGTGLEGATVRHLLDMRTGTREEITTLDLQRDYYATVLWAPDERQRRRDQDSRSHFWRFERVRPHGGDFEYRSTLTCVLAMLAERVTGQPLAELASRHLWEPLGAEHDATITVDGSGHALADIGLSCSLRDLARVGELLRLDGRRPDGLQVVPETWVADTLTPDADQAQVFVAGGSDFMPVEGGYYRNQWWVVSPRMHGRDGVYIALGIHGQLLYVDEAAEVVIAKFSSWPEPWVAEFANRTLGTCQNIAAGLERSA